MLCSEEKLVFYCPLFIKNNMDNSFFFIYYDSIEICPFCTPLNFALTDC